MKKIILSLILVAFACGLRAEEVSSEQALHAVRAWATANGTAFRVTGEAQTAEPMRSASGVLLWYRVTLPTGTVFVAGDSRMEPILGFLPGETFPEGIPEGHPLLTFLMGSVTARYSSLGVSLTPVRKVRAASGTSSFELTAEAEQEQARAQAKWVRLLGTTSTGPRRAAARTQNGAPPIVYTFLDGFYNHQYTHWNQSTSPLSEGEPLYNLYTPAHAVCGCVATKAAALLQYFNVTTGCVGYLGACHFNGSPTNLFTKSGSYDWTILPPTLGGQARAVSQILSAEQRNLLGRVTYNAGVLMNMNYNINGTSSGTDGTRIVKFLKVYHAFPKGYACLIDEKDAAKGIYYDRLVYNQLRAGAPVGLEIGGSGTSGHSVIAVGYGEDYAQTPYVRVFMGWGGSGDGWFNLPQVGNYPLTTGVETDLSRTEDCIPVCGRLTTQTNEGVRGLVGVEVEIVLADGTTYTTRTGAHGAFGVRVKGGRMITPEIYAADVECVVRAAGQEISFTPPADTSSDSSGDSDASQDEPTPLEMYYASLPPAFELEVPSDEAAGYIALARTPAEAQEKALREDKLLLVVSGKEGKASTDAVKAYLASHAEEINEGLIVYYADVNTDPYGFASSAPALAIFNPKTFDAEKGWDKTNGLLSSVNQNETIANEELDAFFASITDITNRLNQGVQLRVMGLSGNPYVFDLSAGSEAYSTKAELKGNTIPSQAYPVSAGELSPSVFTNGQMVTYSVPQVWTNETLGVISTCRGWALVEGLEPQTNCFAGCYGLWREARLYDYFIHRTMNDGREQSEKDVWDRCTYFARGTGTEVTLTLGQLEQTLVWLWDDTSYHVTAVAQREGGQPNDGYGTVEPADAWVAPGSEVTFTAMGALRGGSVQYLTRLKGWGLTAGAGSAWENMDTEAGCTLTIQAFEPRAVTATFDKGTIPASTLQSFNVTVGVEPASLAQQANFPQTKCGTHTLVYDQATSCLAQACALVLESASFTDSTGGVWQCVGWKNGSGNVASWGDMSHVAFPLSRETQLTWVWEPGEDTSLVLPNPPTPTPPSGSVVPTLDWNATLDNLVSGANVVVAAADLPAGFDVQTFVQAYDVSQLVVPTGWVVDPGSLKVDASGNLTVDLSLDEAVLRPAGLVAIEPLATGTFETSCTVQNAAKGFWYSIFIADEVTGPWRKACSLQAQNDGALTITYDDTRASQRFSKVVVTEKEPQ